jgi:hypothetical protein
MQLRDRYPVDTVTGACLVTRRSDVEPIVDLDLDVDTLPAWGRICISQTGVRQLMTCLGWELPEENVLAANAKLRDDNRVLRKENTGLRAAIRNVLDAATIAGLDAAASALDVDDMEPVT